jgi:hypothetical protein
LFAHETLRIFSFIGSVFINGGFLILNEKYYIYVLTTRIMKSIKGLFLGSLLVTVIVACEKDKDLTKTEIIAQKPWKLTSSAINPAYDFPDFGLISDFYALLPDYKRDDIWVFKTNGNYTFEEGATKYDQTSPTIIDMGTWTFNSDETVLTTSSNNSGMSEYDLLELTTSLMRLRYQVIDTLDNIYTVNESYRH